MKQEDFNDLQSNLPSPEALIDYQQRKDEAEERGCACLHSKSYWSSECFYSDHRMTWGMKS